MSQKHKSRFFLPNTEYSLIQCFLCAGGTFLCSFLKKKGAEGAAPSSQNGILHTAHEKRAFSCAVRTFFSSFLKIKREEGCCLFLMKCHFFLICYRFFLKTIVTKFVKAALSTYNSFYPAYFFWLFRFKVRESLKAMHKEVHPPIW